MPPYGCTSSGTSADAAGPAAQRRRIALGRRHARRRDRRPPDGRARPADPVPQPSRGRRRGVGARRGGGARRLPPAPPAGRGARRDARGLCHGRHRDLPHGARRAARGRGRLLHGHGRARARRAGVRGGSPGGGLQGRPVGRPAQGRAARVARPALHVARLRRPRPGPRLRGALAQAAQRAAAALAGARAPADRRGDAHRRETVKSHLAEIRRKLGARTSAQAVAIGLINSLFEYPDEA